MCSVKPKYFRIKSVCILTVVLIFIKMSRNVSVEWQHNTTARKPYYYWMHYTDGKSSTLYYTEKSFRNLIKSNWNRIVFTMHRLIWNQMEVRLVLNQSENGKYNLISVWFNKISKKFLCASREKIHIRCRRGLWFFAWVRN